MSSLYLSLMGSSSLISMHGICLDDIRHSVVVDWYCIFVYLLGMEIEMIHVLWKFHAYIDVPLFQESDRAVTKKEGINFAREYGCLFIECSAKTRVNVQQCFEELVLKILDTPSLLAEGSKGVKKNIFSEKRPQSDASTSSCC